jgi:hypothetical protein
MTLECMRLTYHVTLNFNNSMDERDGTCNAWRGEKCIQYLVGKSEGKRPLGRPRHRWEGNMRMDLREIWWEVVNWMHLVQDRDHWRGLVITVMNFQVP